jgi:hypothetical protein
MATTPAASTTLQCSQATTPEERKAAAVSAPPIKYPTCEYTSKYLATALRLLALTTMTGAKNRKIINR